MRCRICQYTLIEQEDQCPQCGTPVMVHEGPTPLQRRFQIFLTGFLGLMVVMTGLSMFSDFGPSFLTSSSITVILLLIRNSAQEMTADKTSRG